MEKSQLIFFICVFSFLLILLAGFLIFLVFWQRIRSNRFIMERERLKAAFNEQLLMSQIEIQEQSFRTVSMEIHDNVGQTLSLLKMQLNIMEERGDTAIGLLAEAKKNAGKVMADLRDIAQSLDASRIRERSLADMVTHELERIGVSGRLVVAFKIFGEEAALPDERKLIIFRMIQECFQNIIKHANASAIDVHFSFHGESLEVAIMDNGVGFDCPDTPPDTSLGLRNIYERARIIGGRANVESLLNRGTTVSIYIPYV